MVFEPFLFLGCDLDYRSMFGTLEIGGFHRSLVKATKGSEMDEIGCFHKSEIVRFDAENIVHNHPFVFSDAFPCVWSFAAPFFGVNLVREYGMSGVDIVGNSYFDSCGIFLRHKCGEKSTIGHRTDVGVEHLNG